MDTLLSVTSYIYEHANINLIYKWQTLIGSLIGASLPLLSWFLFKWIEERNKYFEKLNYLERVLTLNINKLFDVKMTIESFLNKKLQPTIDRIPNGPTNDISLDSVFFPLFFTGYIDENIFKK
jgi:hypothetical protein